MRGYRDAGCDASNDIIAWPYMRVQAISCIVTRMCAISPTRHLDTLPMRQHESLCDDRDDAPAYKRRANTHVIHHGGVMTILHQP